MSVHQAANRLQYDVSCPVDVDSRRWAAMRSQLNKSTVGQMTYFYIPEDERCGRIRLNCRRSHFTS